MLDRSVVQAGTHADYINYQPERKHISLCNDRHYFVTEPASRWPHDLAAHLGAIALAQRQHGVRGARHSFESHRNQE
jgi:hypothetical protein